MPQHTVIMPVYNGADYLEEALASVLGQSCADLELIVINDSSSDGSAAILDRCARADERVRLASTAINSGGPALPKNIGLALATGNLVSFCDQDDIMLPHKLARASEVYERYPALDLLFFDFLPFEDGAASRPPYLSGKKFLAGASAYLAQLEDGIFRCHNFWGCMAGLHTGISTQTVVCRRALLAGLRFDTRYRIVDDIALWHRLAETARIAYVDQAVARYRSHPQALTGNRELLAQETLAFHRENYFRQRHLLNRQENQRYRQMLARFCLRSAEPPQLSALERRLHLLHSLAFDFRLRTVKRLLLPTGMAKTTDVQSLL